MNFAWSLIWRGLFAVLFGYLALFMSGVTVAVLMIWFGAFVLVGGIFATMASFQAAREHTQWGFLLFNGILGIVVGVLTLASPSQMAVALVWVLGVWALMAGIFEIVAAVTSPWVVGNKGLLAFVGIISILFGVMIIANPLAGAISIVWLMGAYALLVGFTLIVLGFKLKQSA